MLRAIATPFRIVIWLVVAVAAAFGISLLGRFIPASGTKIYLFQGAQIACNLLLAWMFGLMRIRSRSEVGTSILVVLLVVGMPAILLVLAIVSTLFCGIDTCGSH